jgi:hypothetical protein
MMIVTSDTFHDALTEMARLADAAGCETDMRPGNSLHRWLQTHVTYRPEQEFDLMFCLSCDIAKRRRNGGTHETDNGRRGGQ